MYLSILKIWNFRKFGDNGNFNLTKPDCILAFKNGINVLIGENDSGKTAIIDAIKLVVKTHGSDWLRVEVEDFFRISPVLQATRFRIECRFDNLKDEEAAHFTEWLEWEDAQPNPKVYLRTFIDVSRSGDRILPFDIKGGADDDGTILTADAKEKLRSTYLRPLRDAEYELSARRNSRLSQILYSHDAFRNKHDHLFIALTQTLNREITAYFKGQTGEGLELAAELMQGKELKKVIDEYLHHFSGKQTEFEMSGSTLKSVLESLNLLFQDGYNLGLGSHNLLCIASELLHLQKENWDGLRLGLIEEIEAHLHPQVQLQVIDTLQKQATNIQLIFTTHSAHIGSKIQLDRLIICQKNKVFPMGEEHTHLTKTDYGYLQRFLDVTKANLFFAKGIILVEGWAEELLLPALAKKAGKNLTQKGISIVNIGNTAFLRYANIFKRRDDVAMEIKVSVITDVDKKPVEAGELLADEVLQAIVTETANRKAKYDGQVVKSFISPFWTLEYCIAKSVKLRKLFYKSVLQALKEQKIDEGVVRQDNYQAAIDNIDSHFNNWTDDADGIAYAIYSHILNGITILPLAQDNISKAIIAQCFAANLEADTTIVDLTTESSIEYLLNAVTHAAS